MFHLALLIDDKKIKADEFVVAALLPVQRFKKKGENFIYAKSRGMI